jgi:hypothetical protein
MLTGRRRLTLEPLESRLLLSVTRVVAWNTFNQPNSPVDEANFATIISAIGSETVAGNTLPPTILALQESDPPSAQSVEDLLDGLYANAEYERIISALDGGGDTTALIYDSTSIELVDLVELDGPLTHPALRGRFRPLGSTGEGDFFLYSLHLKSGNSASDKAQRQSEMSFLRSSADALGEGADVIFAGDFNMSGSSEGAWTQIVAPGAAQAFDPVGAVGDWFNNSAFNSLHSHSASAVRNRFDLQVVTDEMFDGTGIDYVDGSYHVFGNNGSHTLGESITTGNGATPEVLQALLATSDHLPVVADYEFVFSTPNVRITETLVGTQVIESDVLRSGSIDTYSVVLDTLPEVNVFVTLTPGLELDLGAGSGQAIGFEFTPDNAFTPQTAIVQATNDARGEGTHFEFISHAVASLDLAYDAFPLDDILVTILDDDAPTVVINEIDSNTPGADTLEFIELYDGGLGNTSLDGKVVVLFNGSNDVSYSSMDLDGFSTDDAGYFVLGNPSVAGVDRVFSNGLLQNGADAIALFAANSGDFPAGTPVTTAQLVDAVVYDTNDADDAGLLALLLSGQPQINEDENENQTTESLSRRPDFGTPRISETYVAQLPTPDAANAPQPAGTFLVQSAGRTGVTEAGATDAYTLALQTYPEANVTISVQPDGQLDLGQGFGVPIEIVFTPINAMIPQTIHVMAEDDLVFEGTHVGTIAHSVSSTDLLYDGLTVGAVAVTILDNEGREILINEIDANTEGIDHREFVELYDGGRGNTSLDNLVIVFFNGNGDEQYSAFDLDGRSTDDSGFFVLGNAAVANVDLVFPDNRLQNGADAVALYEGNASSYLTVTTEGLVDAVVYDSDDPDDPGLLSLLLAGEPQLNEDADNNSAEVSLSRIPNGGTPRSTSMYGLQAPSPGRSNLRGDFNDDGQFNCDDIDALVAAVADENFRGIFDLNSDGLLTIGDIDPWLAIAGAANLPTGNPYLPGDATLDGVVDGLDFIVWSDHKFTVNAAWCNGDFNADGLVDGLDFTIWNQHKFTSSDALEFSMPRSEKTVAKLTSAGVLQFNTYWDMPSLGTKRPSNAAYRLAQGGGYHRRTSDAVSDLDDDKQVVELNTLIEIANRTTNDRHYPHSVEPFQLRIR